MFHFNDHTRGLPSQTQKLHPLCSMSPYLTLSHPDWISGGSSGEGSWAPDPPPLPPIRPDACLRLKFLHRKDRISLFNWLIVFNETRIAFCHWTKFQWYSKMELFFGTLLWSVHLCSQSCISRAIGDRCSKIEKNVVVSAFSAGRQLWHKRRMFQGCILYE